MMKTRGIILTIGTLLIMTLPVTVFAQRGNNMHEQQGRMHDQKQKGKLEKVENFTGKIADWDYNDDFIYNGFYLQSGNDKYFVKFPSHLGKQVRNLKGDITVNGVLRYNKEGEKEIKMVNIQANGQTIQDIKTGERDVPRTEQVATGSGKITQFQFNKKGEVNGYILDDKVLLRIDPHKARQLVQMVEVGSNLDYTGVERSLKEGQVAAKNYKIVHCQTLTINGTQYLVK